MSMTNCKDCQHEVSDSAKTCPNCGARVKPASKAWMWIVGIPLVLFLGFAAKGKNDPWIQEMRKDRKTFELCMKDFNDPLTPIGAREFVRATCAMLKQDFVSKYGREP